MSETGYDQYILKDAVKEMKIPKAEGSMVGMVVNNESWPGVEGINCNFAFLPVLKPGLMLDPPHTHETDEFLYFLPGDPTDMKDFSAEIEIAFGEEWKKYTFTSPTVLFIPKGVQHCPLNIKKVGKPFFFGHIMLTPKYKQEKAGEQNP